MDNTVEIKKYSKVPNSQPVLVLVIDERFPSFFGRARNYCAMNSARTAGHKKLTEARARTAHKRGLSPIICFD